MTPTQVTLSMSKQKKKKNDFLSSRRPKFGIVFLNIDVTKL